MANGFPTARIRALLGALLIAGCAAGGGMALAGDEDLSPNAYQEFDPVTGFMVTVDPDAESGHAGDAAAKEGHDGDAVAEEVSDEVDREQATWPYWVIVGVAAVAVVAWLRKKATHLGD